MHKTACTNIDAVVSKQKDFQMTGKFHSIDEKNCTINFFNCRYEGGEFKAACIDCNERIVALTNELDSSSLNEAVVKKIYDGIEIYDFRIVCTPRKPVQEEKKIGIRKSIRKKKKKVRFE